MLDRGKRQSTKRTTDAWLLLPGLMCTTRKGSRTTQGSKLHRSARGQRFDDQILIVIIDVDDQGKRGLTLAEAVI